MTRQRERGFTLIELMIALLISSLLVGMILAIFSRMSLAYRGQQQIAGVQQVLAAARATIELDAKQAGLAVAQGFKVATAPTTRSPVRVINQSTGPDQIAFFYADTSVQAAIQHVWNWTNAPRVGTYTTPTGFAAGDVVVLVEPPTTPTIDGSAVAVFDSCVLRILSISGTDIRFQTAAPWGALSEPHCAILQPAVNTIIYKFVARGYRIDTSTPARAALGPLQMSPTGGLFNNDALDGWTDIAFGFTDLQASLQVRSGGVRDWYSGNDQTTLTAAPFGSPGDTALQISISLVARTDRDVEGITTSATPDLIVAASPDHNPIGDRASVALPSADPALGGHRIYRYTTFQVDFRNLGVGR